jgi:hypothetical protein
MRVTAGIVTTGLATLTLLALAPAAAQAAPTTSTSASVSSAAADWQAIAKYPNYRRCADAGRQYVREGFNEWKCTQAGPTGEYWLWLR